MSSSAREHVTERFLAHLKALHSLAPSLRQGDFGASNILLDPAVNGISAILDWSSAAIGDPAYDLAGVLASYGEQLFTEVLTYYHNGYSARAEFYQARGTVWPGER